MTDTKIPSHCQDPILPRVQLGQGLTKREIVKRVSIGFAMLWVSPSEVSCLLLGYSGFPLARKHSLWIFPNFRLHLTFVTQLPSSVCNKMFSHRV